MTRSSHTCPPRVQSSERSIWTRVRALQRESPNLRSRDCASHYDCALALSFSHTYAHTHTHTHPEAQTCTESHTLIRDIRVVLWRICDELTPERVVLKIATHLCSGPPIQSANDAAIQITRAGKWNVNNSEKTHQSEHTHTHAHHTHMSATPASATLIIANQWTTTAAGRLVVTCARARARLALRNMR